MADQIQSQRVICSGGLNTNENSIILSERQPGSATKLVNFESSKSGGYRRINGYAHYDAAAPSVDTYTAGVPDGVAEGAVLWVYHFYNTTTQIYEVFAARKDVGTATYSIYKNDNGVGWVKETLPAVRNMVGTSHTVRRLRGVDFNFGGGNHLMVVDGVNAPLRYDGTAWTSPTGDQLDKVGPSIISVFKNHIFIGAFDDSESVIIHSGPNDPTEWDSAGGAGQIFPGFDVIQIKAFRDELHVFGQTAIKKITVSGADFVTKEVTQELGCIARDSIVELGGNLLFLSQDGIRPIAGTERIDDVELGLLSRDIQPIIDSLVDNADLDAICSVVIRKKTQFRYFTSQEAIAQEDSWGILGTAIPKGDKPWEFGQTLGIRANCTWSGLRDRKELILHGDYDGIVYRQEVGNTFAGRDILSIYRTPYLDFGDTEIRKEGRDMNIFLDAEGQVQIVLGIDQDWGSPTAINPDSYDFTSTSSSSLYDNPSSIYDSVTTIYGGSERGVVSTNIQGHFFSSRYTFTTQGNYPPFTIQGLVIEFSAKGRQ